METIKARVYNVAIRKLYPLEQPDKMRKVAAEIVGHLWFVAMLAGDEEEQAAIGAVLAAIKDEHDA